MTRYRWYRLSSTDESSLANTVADFALANDYGPGAEDGFQLARRSSSRVSGRHISRRIVSERIVTPDGSSTDYQLEYFDTTNFELWRDTDLWILRLANPPRRMRPFLNALASATEFRLATSPLLLEPELVMSEFRARCDSVLFDGVKVSGTSGSIRWLWELQSGSDVTLFFKEGLNIWPGHETQAISLRGVFLGLKFRMKVSRSGSVVLSTEQDEPFLELMEVIATGACRAATR